MYFNNDDYDDMSMDASNISDTTSIITNKIKNGRGSCAICGAKSTGINFDVLTVNKKIFFYRNNFFLYLVFIMQSIFSTKWC
jgi:hypothetical protein